jgi:hypothetical protein
MLRTERPGHRILILDEQAHAGLPIMLTEFGGIAFSKQRGTWGYSRARTPDDFAARYAMLLETVRTLPLLTGFCYTQFTDTYQEANGLLYMDRKPKFPLEQIAIATRGPESEDDRRIHNRSRAHQPCPAVTYKGLIYGVLLLQEFFHSTEPAAAPGSSHPYLHDFSARALHLDLPGPVQIRHLRDFLGQLERRGELTRVRAEVDPRLEMTEICDRVLKSAGPALLFERPKGHTIPVLGNLFGTPQRVALGMGQDSVAALREVGRLLAFLKEPEPPKGLVDAWQTTRPLLTKVMNMAPKERRSAPCQEIVWEGSDGSPLALGEFEIFGQRLNASGTAVGANDFRISEMGLDGSAAFNGFHPDVTADPRSGEYLVVWDGDEGVDEEYEIWGQRLARAGTEVGGDFRLSTTGPEGNANHDALMPAVATERTPGEHLVVWHGDEINSEFEIYGRRLGVAAPVLTGTDPPGPANNNAPKVKASIASVDAASTIDVFANASCSGTPAVNDAPAGDLIGSGITVTVANNSTTSFSVTSTLDGHVSRCSNAIAYTEQTPPPPPPPPPPIDMTAPVVSGFSVVPAKLRSPKISRFRFRLSERATVRILVERKLPGRRVGKRCVPPTPKLRKRPRCIRFKRVGTLTFRNRPANQNAIVFRGRIGRRVLAAGSYRATITATDAAGNRSKPKRASFVVIRRS